MKAPSYDLSVAPQTPTVPQAHQRPLIAGAGTLVPRAIEGLGEMGMKIAGMLEKHVLEQQKLKDEAQASDLDTNFRMNLQNKLLSTDVEKVKQGDNEVERPAGLLNRELGDATDVAGEFEGYYKDMRGRYLSQARTPEMHVALSKALDSQYMNAREMVIKHEAKQSRLNLAKSFTANIEMQKQDAAAIADPKTLASAVENVKRTQDNVNVLNSYDPVKSELERRKVAGAVVSKAATAVLMITGDLNKAMLLVDSQKEEMADDEYLKLTDSLAKGQQAMLRRSQTVANTAKIQSRYDYLTRVANGEIDWNNINDEVKDVAIKDPELAQAMQNIVQAGGKYVPTTDVIDNFAFMSVARGVMESAMPDQASEFMVNILKGKNGGNISKDKLGVMLSVAKEHAEATKANATLAAKGNWSLTKSAMDALGSVAQFTPVGMVYGFLKAKYDNNLQGEAIKKAAKQTIRQGVVEAYPELGRVPVIPNKIIDNDGNIQTIYEGNLGEYGDFSRDEDQ
jgi:hypothetical protein